LADQVGDEVHPDVTGTFLGGPLMDNGVVSEGSGVGSRKASLGAFTDSPSADDQITRGEDDDESDRSSHGSISTEQHLQQDQASTSGRSHQTAATGPVFYYQVGVTSYLPYVCASHQWFNALETFLDAPFIAQDINSKWW
jgi:hypothetical protein